MSELEGVSESVGASESDGMMDSASELAEVEGELAGRVRAPLREDLEKAIEEARTELGRQREQNILLQAQVLKVLEHAPLDQNQNAYLMSTNISDIKYNNSLAVIHQIRKEFRTISQKYRSTKAELARRLSEKQTGAEEVRSRFEALKSEVLSSGPETKRSSLAGAEALTIEEREIAAELSELRLQVIRLRIDLDQKSKTASNKDELSEGLHLIDFEKLKIENQSLSEKIEERNEELVKLEKKNLGSVHILAHLREKLGFEKVIVASLERKKETVDRELKALASSAKTFEDQLKNEKEKMSRLTQETGIVKNKFLNRDFIRRKNNLEELAATEANLSDSLRRMNKLIARHKLLQRTLSSKLSQNVSPQTKTLPNKLTAQKLAS